MTNHYDEKETELDFTEHWSSFNVQQEVLRGVQLRLEKTGKNKIEHNYEYADIKLNLPSCSNCYPSANFSTFNHRKYKKRKAPKKNKKFSKHKAKDRQCPLRIIELAEPTKIRCLSAWKNSGQILPDYMIERLRRHVMDEKPIVKISDAVHYFKKRTTYSNTRKPKLGSKEYYRLKHIMMLSTIFAYRMLRILQKPLNILLNKELETINNVVSDEIKTILQNKQNSNGINIKDKILDEISKKVTIWIANVLEEASYKQLLEQLNELEEKEGPVLDLIDEIVDSVKIITSSSSSSSTEISEDNNGRIPSVSSIDNLQRKKERSGYISKKADIIQNPDNNLHFYMDDRESHSENKIDSITKLNATNESIDIKYHLKNMLQEKIFNYLVDRIENAAEDIKKIPAKIDNNFSIENNLNELSTNENNNIHKLPLDDGTSNKQSSSNLDNSLLVKNEDYAEAQNTIEISESKHILAAWGKTNLQQNIEYDISGLPINEDDYTTNAWDHGHSISEDFPSNTILLKQGEIIVDKVNLTNKDSSDEILQKQQSNVELQRNTTIAEDSTNNVEESDQGTKKVKFSDINMDITINDLTGLNRYACDQTYNPINQQIAWKRSNEYIFSNYNVGPPNLNLLSFMDEIWPAYNLPPLLKATESVSKSVTSLGNIAEIEEYSIISVSDNNLVDIKRSDSTLIKLINEEVDINHMKDFEKLKEFFDEASVDNRQQDNNPTVEKMFINNDQKSYFNEGPNEKVQINRKEIVYDSGDAKLIKSNVTLEFEPIDTEIKNISEVIRFKSLTIQTSNKKIQTSFETILNYGQLKYYNCIDTGKWCEGLENVTANLEIWATWIDNVCVNTISLKYEEHKWQSATSIKWEKLDNYINVDVHLWSKLYKSLHKGLYKYKRRFTSKQKSSTFQAQNNLYGCKCKKNFKKITFE